MIKMNAVRKLTCFVVLAVMGNIARVTAETCQERPVDLVFVLDASYSIWIPYFNRELAFITDLLTSFDVGPRVSQTHVGVLTFGHGVWPQFYLDSYKSFDEIKDAIKRITHGRGKTTNTGDALEYTRNVMFSSRAGGRENVPRIAVVVSDGRSQKTLFTQEAAKDLQNEGVTLFAISIGFRQDHVELAAIASDPDSKHKFALDDHTNFTAIKEKIVNTACSDAQPWHPRTKTTRTPAQPWHRRTTTRTTDEEFPSDQDPAVKDCENKRADIFFLIDASYSIKKDDFGKEMEFVHDIIDILDLGPNKTRIGFLTFSDVTEFYLNLNYKMSKTEYQQQLNYVKYIGGGTNTATALRRMREEGFESDLSSSSDRTDVAKIAIVLTDGLSINPDLTAREAQLAQNLGIQIFAVGIGSGVDKQELLDIASDPDDRFILHVDDFGSLREIKSKLAARTCTVEPRAPVFGDQAVCAATKPTDLLFIYDAVSLGSWKSQTISQFIAQSIRELNLVSDVLRIGRETENCPSGNIPLGSALQASDMSEIRFHSFSDLLKRIIRDRFSVENGGRIGALKMAVVFIDAGQRINHDVIREMNRLKETVDFLQIVIIGKNTRLVRLGTTLANGRFINVGSYEELNSVADELMSDLCDFFFTTSVSS